MQARTPLSKLARPFMPEATYKKWPPVSDVADDCWMDFRHWQSEFACYAQQSQLLPKEKTQNCGSARSKHGKATLSSRTTSPSGASVCVSEASTIAASPSREESLSDVSINGFAKVAFEIGIARSNNTYVDLDPEDVSEELKECSSPVPSVLLSNVFNIEKPAATAELHQRGECKPCAYFTSKIDGCRNSSDCKFCHLCPAGELKKRKKLKAKAMKEDMRKGT